LVLNGLESSADASCALQLFGTYPAMSINPISHNMPNPAFEGRSQVASVFIVFIPAEEVLNYALVLLRLRPTG